MGRPRKYPTKDEIREHYGLKLIKCVKCGVSGALWRWYTGTELCNECAEPLFIKYLQTLEKVIVVGLVINFLF